MRRIAVTGVNALTPRGTLDLSGFERPPTPFQQIHRFNVEDFPVKIAAEVSCVGQVSLGLTVAERAIKNRDRLSQYPSERIGIFVGAEPERVTLEDLEKAQNSPAQPVLSRDAYHRRSPARLTEELAQSFSFGGPRATLSMACAASASAVAKAFHTINSGRCDAALCVGAALNVEPLLFAGFCLLRAMSPTGKSSPFDQMRDGFVLSDGAGALLLEAEECAIKQGRSKEIIGYLEGAGESLDAYRITDPEPEGKGAQAAINLALQRANRNYNEVSLIKAHATGTLQNDRVEAKVLARLFPHLPPVLAVKGSIGHSIAACGIVELIAALSTLHRGIVEDIYSLTTPDPEIAAINIRPWQETTPHQRSFSGRVALCNTFGFGGINCSLLVSAS
jgi:3-oxoacyl-[acyl-carrier-protein] synthase II